MDEKDLLEKYPRLFHMAQAGSWPSIQKHGLLSTASLVDLFEVPAAQKVQLLTRRRPQSVVFEHPIHGVAVVRDQHPISEQKLVAALTEMSVKEWFELLNSQVFFWLTEKKLESMMGARPYRDLEHDVLIADTSKVLGMVSERVRLSPINSGATLYKAPQRGRTTFRTVGEYPFAERRFRGKDAVIELAVIDGISNVEDVLLRVERRRIGGEIIEVLWTSESK